MAALIELGAGFHPEYTGRENIQMAAALMGMSRGELDSKLEEILQFADIGRYIDEPIKHYSSGMVVRLGFALIAAHRPDLLITDEVLAVGDEAFQRKCVRWIEDYLSTGGTLFLVSHSMYHIQKLCKSAIWIHHGQVEAQGDVFEVTQKYLAFQEQRIASQEQERAIQAVAGEFNVKAIHFNGDTNDTPMVFNEGSSLLVSIDVVQTGPHTECRSGGCEWMAPHCMG